MNRARLGTNANADAGKEQVVVGVLPSSNFEDGNVFTSSTCKATKPCCLAESALPNCRSLLGQRRAVHDEDRVSIGVSGAAATSQSCVPSALSELS